MTYKVMSEKKLLEKDSMVMDPDVLAQLARGLTAMEKQGWRLISSVKDDRYITLYVFHYEK